MSGPCFGLSWGAENGAVAVSQAGTRDPEIAANADGHRTTPMWLTHAQGELMLGATAKAQAIRHAARSVGCVAQLLTIDAARARAAGGGGKLPFTVHLPDEEEPSPPSSPTGGEGAAPVVRLLTQEEVEGEDAEENEGRPADTVAAAAVLAGELRTQVINASGGAAPSAVVVAVPRHLCSKSVLQEALIRGWGADWCAAAAASAAPSSPARKQRHADPTPSPAAVGGKARPSLRVISDDAAVVLASVPRPWLATLPSIDATVAANAAAATAEGSAPAAAAAAAAPATPARVAVVLDWGATQLTVSVFAILADGGVAPLASEQRLRAIGGNYLDEQFANGPLLEAVRRKLKSDLSDNARSRRKLTAEAAKAKCVLSTAMTTSIEIESLVEGRDFVESVTRSRFEAVVDSSGVVGAAGALVDRVLSEAFDAEGAVARRLLPLLQSAAAAAGLEVAVVCAGGVFKTPRILQQVRPLALASVRKAVAAAGLCPNGVVTFFGNGAAVLDPTAPGAVLAGAAPDELAALGACVCAQLLVEAPAGEFVRGPTGQLALSPATVAIHAVALPQAVVDAADEQAEKAIPAAAGPDAAAERDEKKAELRDRMLRRAAARRLPAASAEHAFVAAGQALPVTRRVALPAAPAGGSVWLAAIVSPAPPGECACAALLQLPTSGLGASVFAAMDANGVIAIANSAAAQPVIRWKVLA